MLGFICILTDLIIRLRYPNGLPDTLLIIIWSALISGCYCFRVIYAAIGQWARYRWSKALWINVIWRHWLLTWS